MSIEKKDQPIEWTGWEETVKWPFKAHLKRAFNRPLMLVDGRVSVVAVRPADSGSTWSIDSCGLGTLGQFALGGDEDGSQYEVKFGWSTPEFLEAMPEFDGW